LKRFPFFDDPLVLASSSPRRRYLLGLVGIRHRVIVPRVKEEDHAHEDPVKHVMRLAGLKAHSVRGRARRGIILGADTIVLLDGAILGKPRSKAEAKRMLRRLSGRWHTVYTGLAVVDAATGKTVEGVEQSRVRIRKMADAEIEAYIATGEPMDKAGAYGIQGYGAAIVEQVRGCYFNVVGLPMVRLLRLVRELKRRAKVRD
jgi:septum formation protein